MKQNKMLAILCLILTGGLLFWAGLAVGQGNRDASAVVQLDGDPAGLVITAQPDSDASQTVQISTGDPQQMVYLCYDRVKDVLVTVQDQQMDLLRAMEEKQVTVEDIYSQALADAACGRCTQTLVGSTHGLTHYNFAYPGYCLRLIYDVLEAPDGENYWIGYVGIYHSGASVAPFTDLYDQDGKRLDGENWGLSFEVVQASATGATVEVSHSNGQQIGDLQVNSYTLSRMDGTGINGVAADVTYQIPLEETSAFQLNWEQSIGTLESGEYQLTLWVWDVFDAEQVHPLMDDFQDWTIFDLTITVP